MPPTTTLDQITEAHRGYMLPPRPGRAGESAGPGSRLAGPPGPATSPPSPTRRRPPRPPLSKRSQMGMADTMKAFPKKSAEDLADRLRLKSCRSRSSSDCCLEPPLGAMVEPQPRDERAKSGPEPGAEPGRGRWHHPCGHRIR